MIDRKTMKKIQAINKEIPQEWKDNLMEHVIDRSYEDEAKKILKESQVYTDLDKEIIQKAIDDGKFIREYDRANPEIEKKIDEFITKRMNEEIKKGNIKPMLDTWAKKIFKKTV